MAGVNNGYAHMDHADWVERNNAAAKMQMTDRQGRSAKAGRGYAGAPAKLSAFQRRAFDILGMVGGGIYNAPITWETVEYSLKRVEVSWRNTSGMSTFDANGLTLFVFLCHIARIRGNIRPSGPGTMRITLAERDDSDDWYCGHPNLVEALDRFRAYLPADHPVVWREAAKQADGETGAACS